MFLTSLLYSQYMVTIPEQTERFDGQVIIVTGSNTGLGKEASRHYVKFGAKRVILAVRNLEAGEAAKKDILATAQRDDAIVDVWQLDLASYASVKAFAKKVDLELDRLDIFLSNAGIATDNFSLAEGYERTMTVNVVSNTLLALLVLPKLKATAAHQILRKPHLTIVASEIHNIAKFPDSKLPADQILAAITKRAEKGGQGAQYALSKLWEILIVKDMVNNQDHASEYPVVINCMTPGLCRSDLAREHRYAVQLLYTALRARSTAVGARTLVAATTGGPTTHGKYLSDAVVVDEGASAQAKDVELQRKVWDAIRPILEEQSPGCTSNL